MPDLPVVRQCAAWGRNLAENESRVRATNNAGPASGESMMSSSKASSHPDEPTGPFREDGAAFDAHLANFADASLDQSTAFAHARWGRRDETALVLRKNDTVSALARAVVVRLPFLGGGIAHVKFGPVWRRRNHPPEPADYADAVRNLVKEYCEGRGLMLTIQPRPDPAFQAVETAILEEQGFVARPPGPDRTRYIVQIEPDPSARLAAIGTSWRRNLRKALNAGVVCSLAEGGAAVPAFAAMHAEMVARKNAAHGDRIDVLPSLAGLSAPLRPLIFLSYLEGVPVAGAVVDIAGDPAQYLFGASSAKGLAVRAGYALHWQIIDYLSEQGFARYDLGGSAGDEGLARFKGGLVGSGSELLEMTGPFDRWIGGPAWLRGKIIYKLRDLGARIDAARR